ncbi:Transcription factor Opi1 [Lasallia pustulata]|uniref:Transcription factor Opi1 n=1 Tax=Lasallia pustulata TaxID=136370 RepID=A0A1W5D449_9LECA|nr:Transcription factor Opi1 [Lasallia pustulata]
MQAQLQHPHDGATVPPYEAWPSVPKGPLGLNAEVANSSGMHVDDIATPDTVDGRAASVLSMDDIEAAQALEGLRTDFLNSPARQPAPLPTKTDTTPRSQNDTQEPEPLLRLLTSTHPMLSTAINGSLSAYSSSKTYSPRFRSGAEFVERHIGNPVASTVGTAGRISGVETGVRWWLQRTDSHGQEGESNKRRKVANGGDAHKGMDIEKGLQDIEPRPQLNSHQHRRSSEMSYADSLPAYDDHRSPNYEEQTTPLHPRRSQSPQSQTWQTRLIMSTSGLGVAMSDESLRSLRYCLSWLRWANAHLGEAIVSLKNVLEEWSRSQQQQQQQQQRNRPRESDTPMTDPPTSESCRDDETPTPRDQATISSHLAALKADILRTLKKVVDVVSTYAGGALPHNARVLVRRHLTSLPQRFRLASTSEAEASESSRARFGDGGARYDGPGGGGGGWDDWERGGVD